MSFIRFVFTENKLSADIHCWWSWWICRSAD